MFRATFLRARGGRGGRESRVGERAEPPRSGGTKSRTGKNGDETTRIGARMSSFGRVSSRRVDALCNVYRATAKSAGTRAGNEERRRKAGAPLNSTLLGNLFELN